jgi:RNA polymerase sigma-70 factor (ECF subfamily)
MVSDHNRRRWQSVQTLDRASLTAIYDDCHQPIYRYVYRLVGDVETARDLAADVFQRLLRSAHNGNGPPRNPEAWLYRTAHNIVVDYFRRRQHRQHFPLDDEMTTSAEDGPERIAEERVSAAQVRAALQHLTPDQQQVIALKFLQGLSNQEVAVVLEKSVGAVKSLQHRALSALRRELAAEDKERILA